MFRCPNCNRRQVRTTLDRGVFWVCEGCGGRCATVRTLQPLIDPKVISAFWTKARKRRPATGQQRRCPCCVQPMREIALGDDLELPTLDVCRSCKLFWFDPGEYESLPPPPASPPSAPAKPAEVQKQATAATEEEPDLFLLETNQPTWHWLFFLVGYPVEMMSPRLQRLPWTTWALASSIALVSLAAFLDPSAVAEFGLIPAQCWRLGGATFISSFFLHAGLLHLLGNLYFLLVFGDNVEDYLGGWLFLLLVLLGDLAGNVMQIALDPTATTRVIGASGGISAVIAYYALRFPRSRLLFLFGYFYPFAVSVWFWFVIWVIMQFVGVWLQLRGMSSVAAIAHLGGVGMGVIFWGLEVGPPVKRMLPQVAPPE
jgi:membrane associated rhomboid family serine protease